MAWHVSPRSLETPGRVIFQGEASTASSPSVLEDALRRDRAVVALVLVTVIAASWLYLITGAGTGVYPHEMASLVPKQTSTDSTMLGATGMSGYETMASADGNSSTVGMEMSPATWAPGYALLMFGMWWLMMIAMMLSGAAPVVLLHAAVTREGLARTEDGRPNRPSHRLVSSTTAFMAGYLLTWGGFSLTAVVAQWALQRGELLSPVMTSRSGFLGSALLLGAGLWQLTPLKTVCLRQCRSPISFLASHWRPGVEGAFRMGVRHGIMCLGCCWCLMALLFYAGVMNLTWIIGIALLILVEKTAPAGVAIGRASGMLLVVSGAWLGLMSF